MNGKFADVVNRWWKILAAAVFVIGAYFKMQFDIREVQAMKVTFDRVEARTQSHHDFIVAQAEINRNLLKTVESIDRKMDKLIRR